MKVRLREVTHADFKDINELFVEIYKKQPYSGFEKAYFKQGDFLGYCLIDDSLSHQPLVGYFGCFTFNRVWKGYNYTYYNTHSWIVKEEYRSQSLRLLMSYIKIKDGIITNFSANAKVAQILEQVKFTKLGIINSVLKTPFKLQAYQQQRKLKEIPSQNNYLNAHKGYSGLCLSLSGFNNSVSLDLILKAIDKKPLWVKRINKFSKKIIRKPLITKNYKLFKIHYTSDYNVLITNISAISHYLFLRKRVGGIIIPHQAIPDLEPKLIAEQYEDQIFYKSNFSDIPPIDYLFSEVFYLNIVDK